jgi:hypothetical protein
MQDILQYIVKWSIALCAVFLFYRFVLRPLTFYQWNRRYLVAYSIVALFIPFINLYTYVPEKQLQQNQLVKFIPVINIGQQQTASTGNIDPWLIGGVLMLAGSLFLLARLAIQWISLLRIRRNATRIYHPEAKVYHVNENVIPFSFGDAIYVNTSLHTEEELNDIILHEFVHVRQKHSFDIIWSEILCILNWYNPFAWLIRNAIRQNLEFIADQSVLTHGLDKTTYQYHLLKVIGSSQYSIANNFNFSSLKKRIAMMNRLKSARVHLVKFLFVLPLLAVMLVAFRNSNGNWYKDINTDTIKKPDPAALAKIKDVMKQGFKLVPLDEFYKQNTSVKEVAWSSDEEIVLYLKNGTREAYDSNNENDMKKLASSYNGIPAVFPLKLSIMPPPALPPTPGIKQVQPPKAGKPAVIEVPATTETVALAEVEIAEPVLHLKGNVSVSLVTDSVSPVVAADEIVVHGSRSKAGVKTMPVYYVDGQKSVIQDSRLLVKTLKISHAEIVDATVAVQAAGEVKTATIINLITVQNAKNKNAYLSKESVKLVEEVKVKEVPKPREY